MRNDFLEASSGTISGPKSYVIFSTITDNYYTLQDKG